MTVHSTELPRSPEAVGTARWLVNVHGTALDSARRYDATLMVSELVTNAVVHGIGTILLRIATIADGMRIEVADEGDIAIAPGPAQRDHGGWGLRIVDQLADDWGILKGRTRVWFRVNAAGAGGGLAGYPAPSRR